MHDGSSIYDSYKRQRSYLRDFDWDSLSCIFSKVCCTRKGKLKNVASVIFAYLMVSTLLGAFCFTGLLLSKLPQEYRDRLDGIPCIENLLGSRLDPKKPMSTEGKLLGIDFWISEGLAFALAPTISWVKESHVVDKHLWLSYTGTMIFGGIFTTAEAKIQTALMTEGRGAFPNLDRNYAFLGAFLGSFIVMRIFKAYFLMCGYDLYHQLTYDDENVTSEATKK